MTMHRGERACATPRQTFRLAGDNAMKSVGWVGVIGWTVVMTVLGYVGAVWRGAPVDLWAVAAAR